MAAVLPTATGDLRKGSHLRYVSQMAAFSSGKEELRNGGAIWAGRNIQRPYTGGEDRFIGYAVDGWLKPCR